MAAPSAPSPAVLIVIFCIVLFGGYLFFSQRKKPEEKEGSFTTDLTELAKRGKLPHVVGMDQAIERVLHVIARKSKK